MIETLKLDCDLADHLSQILFLSQPSPFTAYDEFQSWQMWELVAASNVVLCEFNARDYTTAVHLQVSMNRTQFIFWKQIFHHYV